MGEPAIDLELPELFTSNEAAAVLRVSPMTVRRFIVSGDLIAHRIGKQWRIERTSVEALLGRSEFDEDIAAAMSYLARRGSDRMNMICPSCSYHPIDKASQFGWCARCTTSEQIRIDAANEREKARKLRWWHEHGQSQRTQRQEERRATTAPAAVDLDEEETLRVK